MLPAMPPWIRPTLAVVSASIRPSGMSAIARAAATIALRPSLRARSRRARRGRRNANRSVCWVGAASTMLPIGGGVVVAVPELRAAAARCRSALRPAQADLLHRRQHELDAGVRPRPCGRGRATAASIADDRGLVVGAEDGVVRVRDDAVLHNGLDRRRSAAPCRGGRSGRSASAGASVAGSAAVDVADLGPDLGAGAVLVRSRPRSRRKSSDAVGDRPLLARRAGDGGQLDGTGREAPRPSRGQRVRPYRSPYFAHR